MIWNYFKNRRFKEGWQLILPYIYETATDLVAHPTFAQLYKKENSIFVRFSAAAGGAIVDLMQTGLEAATNFRRFIGVSTPGANPPAGNFDLYFSDTGQPYYIDSSGNKLDIPHSGTYKGELNGLRFDGVNGQCLVANNDNINFGTGDFSLEAFFLYPTIPSPPKYILAKGGGGIIGTAIYIDTNGTINIQIQDAGGNTTITSTAQVANKWLHLIAIYKRDGLCTIYVNNKVSGSGSISTRSGSITNTSRNLSVGSFGGSDYFNCLTSFVRLHNYALTAADVQARWNAGRPELWRTPYALQNGKQNVAINGTFDSNVTGWSATRCTIIWDAGQFARCTQNDTGNNTFNISQTSLTISKRYKITFRAKSPNITTLPGIISAHFTDIVNQIRPNLSTDWQNYELYGTALETIFILYGSTAGVAVGSIVDFDDIVIQQLGCVLELRGENAGHNTWLDTSGNNLHGTVSGGAIPLIRPAEQKIVVTTTSTTPTISIPAGYAVERINMTTAQNLTVIQVQQATSLLNLITGESLNNGSISFQVAKHRKYATANNLNLTLTGNGGLGTTVTVELKKSESL